MKFPCQHCGQPYYVHPLDVLRCTPGTRTRIKHCLSRYSIDPRDLPHVSDHELLRVPGLGPHSLRVIRQHFPLAL